MKRILAVFLTLAMALNIAPMAAFAAADSDAASIVAVDETDETSSSQLDEETARAIASDPFLQAAYAQTEQEQTGQAEVDTSNMSVSATNSFGQLLVNGLGMDGENGSDLSSESRVIEITMNGSTAMVKYIAKKDANLVVGIYTDDSEQEMIASGTVAVQATPDNTASSIVEVPLSGEVPEHYTVKGFLLDKEDHAPLCGEYTNAFYTENVEELEGATIDDFDSARAVNLDDNRTTNFGVVKQGVILLQEDELENGAGENIVVLDDSENQIYQFENASTELLNLKQGNIIVYKYGENNLIIAHVADLEINGTTVTIYGDEDFQLEDVFSILKMDGENTTDEAIVDTETGDGKVSYIGTQEIETLDSTNEWEGKAEFSHVFKISTDDGKDEDSEEKPVSGSVEGTVSIKAAIELKLRLCDDNKMVSMSFPTTEKFELEGSVEYKGEVLKFPKITLPVYGCLSVGFEPQMVFKANASVAFKMESTQMIGFEWSQKDGTQNISEAPVTSINFKLSGSIYLGFDMAPKAELGVGKVSLVKLKFKAEAGFELSAEERLGDQGTGLDEIHGCKNCYEGELEFKITLGIGLKILLYEPKIEITPFSHSFGKAYASADYGDFGWGECPHVKYRLTLKAGKAGAGATVKIQSNDSDTSSLYTETTLDADGNSTVYLPEREYRITANKGSMEFVKTIKLSRGTTVNIDLEQGSTGGNPGTTEPDKPNPDTPDEDEEYNISMGVLNIKKASVMVDYETADAAPWSTERDAVTRVNVDKSILRISRNALAQFANLKEVYLNGVVTEVAENAFANSTLLKDVYYAGTVAEWNAVQLGAGNDVLEKATIHCSDGVLAESGTCGENVIWTLTTDGLLTISGQGAMGTPDKNWAYSSVAVKKAVIKPGMTSVVSNAFMSCASLKEVVLPEGIETIGAQAFYNCYALESVSIPEGVREIGARCFYNCYKLTEAVLPQTVSAIGSAVFYHCSALKKVELPVQITTMDTASMFSGCPQLTEVQLPDGVTKIGAYAFSECTSLTTVKVPESVTSIGESAFNRCSNLENLNLPAGITSMECKNTFNRCKKLTAKIVVPDGTTKIGDSTFQDCEALTEIVLPDTVTEIGKNAFNGCKNWSNPTIPSKVTSIGEKAYDICKQMIRADIPAGVTQIEDGTFEYCSALQSVTIPAGVKQIGSNAFAGCSALETVKLPDSVAAIGAGAFARCTSLNSINVPDGVQSIESNTFWQCMSLKTIALPESVNQIGKSAFEGCYKLEQITMPAQLTELGERAFCSCHSLQSITIPNGITSIGRYTFAYCEVLTSAVIPEGVTTVGECAFEDCGKLYSLQIPAGVKQIGSDAFWDCSALETVKLPDSVAAIGAGAFARCTSLNSINVPDGVQSIESNTFWQCMSLKTIALPESVNQIGKSAFEGCYKLEQITMPAQLTELGERAFCSCYSLQSITIPNSITSIGRYTFCHCEMLTSAVIPEGVTTVGKYAFEDCIKLKTVNYGATKAKWNDISIDNQYDSNAPLLAATIHCTDGDIVPNTENSITTGTASTSGSKFQATFANAKAGKEYVVLVSRSDSDPLNADNLIYINQITADADGELTVPFITAADAAEMTYVVACAQDDASVDPDQPVEPGQPDQPGEDKPSSGGDGGGAIILIGGVAAVAAVAGVVLLMPVKVEGTVKLADQPVANATVQVLKGDTIKAETVTDANGHFTVKVKRGGYTLRVQWTDASGQPVARTVDFKAPNANLNVAA